MSEAPKQRRGHPIRLAMFMLIGVGFGALCCPARQGHGQHVDMVSARLYEMACFVGGSLVGVVTELFVRAKQRD
jgi:hypothetical protein